MTLGKALYELVKKHPGKTSKEISLAFDGFIMGNYYSRASINSCLSALVATGQLRRELAPGRERGGKYFVDSYFDQNALNVFYNAPKKPRRPSLSGAAAAKTSIDRDTLRTLTRKYARAYPYNVPGSQLVHQSLYDLCLELGVTVTGV